ncbi:MAG: AAA family ATPase [Candidatus Cloacimonetes bacterium]|nr:AAA family ATPase [Candidatus Cloacimonadota bacterium]
MEYRLFNEFVQTFLVEGKDFLSGSGKTVLTPEALDECIDRFIVNAIEGSDLSFDEKLNIQFADASQEAKILFAHVTWLYVHPHKGMTASGKNDAVRKSMINMPEYTIRDGIFLNKGGIANGGTAYNIQKPTNLEFIIFLIKWIKNSQAGKDKSSIKKGIITVCLYWLYGREEVLEKEFGSGKAQKMMKDSRLFRNDSDELPRLGICNFLLNLCDPDYYEKIVSCNEKKLIAENLFKAEYGSEEGLNYDDKIYLIKRHLMPQYPNIDPEYFLRDDAIQALWNPPKINYWLFQCNPNFYDIVGALNKGMPIKWKVAAYKDKIRPQDKVIIWVNGAEAGCYALAEVTSEVELTISDDWEKEFWKTDDAETPGLKVEISILHNLANRPLLKPQLEGIGDLGGLKAGNQGTNFKATDKQYKALEKMALGKGHVPHNDYKEEEPVKDDDWEAPDYKQHPLNQILFGPPGTGKTYNSINLAVEIADPGFMSSSANAHNRVRITKRYRELVDEGRIVFTTFHQSMSYEDFIEGIKPLLSTEQDCQMQYKIVPGIFKRICDLAATQAEQSLTTKELSQPRNYSRPNEELSDSVVHIEKTGFGNKLPSRDAVFDRAYESIVSDIKDSINNGQIYYFDTKQGAKHRAISVLPNNDIQIKRQNAPSMNPYAVRRDVLKALFMHFPNMDNITIKDHDDYIRYELGQGASNGPTNIAILLRLAQVAKAMLRKPIANDKINSSANESSLNAPKVSDDYTVSSYRSKNYVIIIDEINRGNVSQIFGELITLIEPDKRAGNREALEVTLPYSKEKFSVPSNLYIIGTMNTADRSVEALDTALRRRFSFIEATPDYGLFEDAYFEDISLKTLLETINKRIEGLLDEDHAIGHSYFLRVMSGETSLKQVFFNEIIPLLQEYFYGNYSRIELVIGTGFVKAIQVQQSDYATPSSDNEVFNDHIRYTLVKEAQMDDFAFLSALRTLMNESDEA